MFLKAYSVEYSGLSYPEFCLLLYRNGVDPKMYEDENTLLSRIFALKFPHSIWSKMRYLVLNEPPHRKTSYFWALYPKVLNRVKLSKVFHLKYIIWFITLLLVTLFISNYILNIPSNNLYNFFLQNSFWFPNREYTLYTSHSTEMLQ